MGMGGGRDGHSTFTAHSGRERPSESGQFQRVPEAILSYLSSCLKSFPAEWNVSILEETVPQSCPENGFLSPAEGARLPFLACLTPGA